MLLTYINYNVINKLNICCATSVRKEPISPYRWPLSVCVQSLLQTTLQPHCAYVILPRSGTASSGGCMCNCDRDGGLCSMEAIPVGLPPAEHRANDQC